MQPQKESDRRALDTIVERATVDRAFRQQLLVDPRSAIRDELGLTIPARFRIRFIERGPDLDALVVLPDFKSGEQELSDDELEAVSGGAHSHASWSDPPVEAALDHPNGRSHARRADMGNPESRR